MPVDNPYWARIDPESFWYYPWGDSGIHRGVDIFSQNQSTTIIAPVSGLILETGYGGVAGNYIYIMGPQFKTYYFAHLDTIYVKPFTFISKSTALGLMGNTGNAKDKPPHLHYSIYTIIPYPWLYDNHSREGWKKMNYLDPTKYM